MSARALRGAAVVGLGTLIEAVRTRLLLVSVAFTVVLVGLSVAAASVSIGDRGRLIVDVGLAAASALGSAVALALTISSFAGEIKNRTAYTVLVRPLPRWAFVLGKFLGNGAAMASVVTLMVLSTAAIVMIYGEPVPNALWSCWWLTIVEMALVVAVALLFSTIATPVLAATYTVGFVLAGNLASDVSQLATRLIAKGKALGYVLRVVFYAMPDLEALSARQAAANNLETPNGLLAYGTMYGFAYAACALCIAMWVFSRRESV